MKVKMKQGKKNKIENSSRRGFLLLETPKNKAENSKLKIICSGGRGSRWKEPRIKISVNTDISVTGFYGNIGNIGKYRWKF